MHSMAANGNVLPGDSPKQVVEHLGIPLCSLADGRPCSSQQGPSCACCTTTQSFESNEAAIGCQTNASAVHAGSVSGSTHPQHCCNHASYLLYARVHARVARFPRFEGPCIHAFANIIQCHKLALPAIYTLSVYRHGNLVSCYTGSTMAVSGVWGYTRQHQQDGLTNAHPSSNRRRTIDRADDLVEDGCVAGTTLHLLARVTEGYRMLLNIMKAFCNDRAAIWGLIEASPLHAAVVAGDYIDAQP